MFINFLFLAMGLALLLGGGDVLVRGASGLARALGISPLIIGLTVVAMGTSMPEMVVNVLAAWRGSGDLSFGNIIGSNMANVGLILGIAALMSPLVIEGTVIRREIPMMLLATLCAVVMACDPLWRGVGKEAEAHIEEFGLTSLEKLSAGMFDRGDGLILLLLFCVFLYYLSSDILRQRRDDAFIEETEGLSNSLNISGTGRNLFLTGAGMASLILGGHWTVNAAVSLAEVFSVPEAIIGLTVVAVGTSLPELATSLVATYRKQTDLAVGNIVGSNIFNLLLVMGVTATLSNVTVPEGGYWDLMFMLLLSVLLMPFARIGKGKERNINRMEGGILLLIYLGYCIYRSLNYTTPII